MILRVPKKIIIAFLFACIGITVEVFFTAVRDVVVMIGAEDSVNWRLQGRSYLWMLFIYAQIPLFFWLFQRYVQHLSVWIKALLFVPAIYVVEFISGFLLEQFIGRCPWKYDEGWHIMGYIRLDYFPYWYVFALLVVLVYQMLNRRIK